MSPADVEKARKEARENLEKPVGERPMDRRSREEVVTERDARHLDAEAARGTGALTGAEDATSSHPQAGAERRMREGTPQAKEPDGRPYGAGSDPDAYGDKAGNLGGTGGKP